MVTKKLTETNEKNKNILEKSHEELRKIIGPKKKKEQDLNKIKKFIKENKIKGTDPNGIKEEDYPKYLQLIEDLNKIFTKTNQNTIYDKKGVEYDKNKIASYFKLEKGKEINNQLEKIEPLKTNELLLNIMFKEDIYSLDKANKQYEQNITVINSLVERAKTMKQLDEISTKNYTQIRISFIRKTII